jgi:tetratricopeptide (TPR) repeat protein
MAAMGRAIHDGGVDAALALHRAGKLERARAAYEALLEATPEHANLLGLLGVVALQQGAAEQAEALLRQALAAESDARVRLRNLNNLIALLRQTGRRQAAEALLAEGVPDWPEGVEPDAAERGTVLSLGWALLLLGKVDLARRLVEQAIPDPEGDAGVLALAGRLELELGDPQTALGQLERAAEVMPDDCDLQIGIGYALHRLGQRDAARAKAREIARNWPVFSTPPRRTQRADVLVLNTAPSTVNQLKGGLSTLHFSGNFASQLLRDMQDEFRFHSAFGDIPPEAFGDRAPTVGVVLNNCVNGETMNLPGRLERALHAVHWAGRPVINHPEAVAAVLAHDRAEARTALTNLGAPEIYAVEYVPLQKKSGHFRKIRALLAEDEIVCAVPGFYSTWMVSGARRQATGMAFYRAHPETVEESRRIALEPESVLGVDCLRVLEAVRDRMPLDFFGIDFDVDDDGQVVFFEANAAMNLLKHPGDPADIALPDAPFERIKEAFRRAVDRRTGAPA